jgi:hypothetical protein
MSALKGQIAFSPGQRPGYNDAHNARPERAKALYSGAFALSGREFLLPFEPRALPWAICSLPLRGVPLWYDFILPKLEIICFSAQLALPLTIVLGRRRFGKTKKKIAFFLFFRSACTTFAAAFEKSIVKFIL